MESRQTIVSGLQGEGSAKIKVRGRPEHDLSNLEQMDDSEEEGLEPGWKSHDDIVKGRKFPSLDRKSTRLNSSH